MAVSIAAGELNKRVTVRRLKSQLTPDATGHVDNTNEANWQDVAKRWAKFTTRGSREFFRGEQVAAEITHQITMRYDKESAAFTTTMKLVMGTRQFNIAEPPRNIDEANVKLEFGVIEVK